MKSPAREFISPRQLAAALGVSESSIKRWIDRDLVKATRTAGGHRRISLASVLEFLQRTNRELTDPGALGLPAGGAPSPRSVQAAAAELAAALTSGRSLEVLRLVLDQHLGARRDLATIFDQIMAPAFRQIGDGWECGEVEVYEERRACEITQHVLHQLHEIVEVPPSAPRAIGGTMPQDAYTVPTKMVELVLRQGGWAATSLGANLPGETMRAAIFAIRPRLFWLSCSHIASETHFQREFRLVWAAAGEAGAELVLGGRAVTAALRRTLPPVRVCDSLGELQAMASDMLSEKERRAAHP